MGKIFKGLPEDLPLFLIYSILIIIILQAEKARLNSTSRKRRGTLKFFDSTTEISYSTHSRMGNLLVFFLYIC